MIALGVVGQVMSHNGYGWCISLLTLLAMGAQGQDIKEPWTPYVEMPEGAAEAREGVSLETPEPQRSPVREPSHGLDSISDALQSKRNPVFNLPQSFGGAITSDLRAITTSIGDHGNLAAQSITHEKEKEKILEQTEAASEEAIKTSLVSIISDITAALTAGQDKISYAVPAGQHKVSSSLDAGHDKMSAVIVLGQDKVYPALENNSKSLDNIAGAL